LELNIDETVAYTLANKLEYVEKGDREMMRSWGLHW
jgi:hypothetical protein